MAGLLLSMTNPLAFVFWSGVVGVLGLGDDGIWDRQTAPALLSALMAGALAWSLGAAAAIGWGRRAMGRGTLRAAEVLAGVALGFFGLQLLWDTARTVVSIVGA